jgi:hypothetical protein
MTSSSTDRRISIVVPCYNRAAYLQVLLQSLTWSAVPPSEFEVIVVNDGGVDHVGLVVETWRRRGLDVRLHQLRADGAPRNNAIARNTGLREARYPIILQTDPDIVFVSDVLQRMREALRPGVFCSCSGYFPLTREATLELAFGAEGPQASAAAYLAHATGRPNQVRSPDGVGGLHGAFACSKADLLCIGGYDESFEYWGWEDRELLVTLAQDAGLVREYVAETPVVHLWHPTLRGETSRDDLAAVGALSRPAWDVQMQRACAEYPRSQRPRRRQPSSSHGQTVFTPLAYDEWTAGTEPTRRLHQLFFDAHCLEAAQLRARGHVSTARALLYYTLRRPWESAQRLDEWTAYAEPIDLETLSAFESRHYEREHVVLEELIACEQQIGDADQGDIAWAALMRLPDGAARASALRARAALCRGDLEAVTCERGDLRGDGWTAARAALAIEIALLTGQAEEALSIAAAAVRTERGRGDYYEQLRWSAYAGLLARLNPEGGDVTAFSALPTELGEERTEFVYSAAIRSLQGGLDIAASLLLDRFLRGGAAAESRLYEEGREHLARARDRVLRQARHTVAAAVASELHGIGA